jgi:peptidoglycan/LPS O-acetylase OafA/YrhL
MTQDASHTRLPGLDGVRALAVVGVVWHHAGPGGAALPSLPFALNLNGFLGVDLFFVLSGLLITGLLLREHARSGRISLTKFYMRRSLRIFPLYYAVLALLTLYFAGAAASGSSQRSLFLHDLPWLLTYTSNWVPIRELMGITWSLSTEEQFYLAWPPLLAWLGRRALWPLLIFLSLNQALNLGLLNGLWPALDHARHELAILQATFTPILLGVLLAFALDSPPQRAALQRLTAGPAGAAWLLLLAVLACWPGDIQGWPRLAFHVVATVSLAGIVLHPSSRVVSVLEWKPLAFVGMVSYGIYLLHMLVLDVAQRALSRWHVDLPGALFMACFIGTVALAALSYRFFERPLLRLKDRWRSA